MSSEAEEFKDIVGVTPNGCTLEELEELHQRLLLEIQNRTRAVGQAKEEIVRRKEEDLE